MNLRSLMAESLLPRLETRILLQHITGFNQAQLISRDDTCVTVEQLKCFLDYQQRALLGEPIAYLLGYKEFYGRNFQVTPATLIPRPETELLVDKVLELAPSDARIIDLGTGSGCIAISCKLERPDLQVVAVDVSSDALQVATSNAYQLNASVEFINSNWLIHVSGKFAIIVSNPPYIEHDDQHLANLRYEPISALTDFGDGLEHIRIICAQSQKYLQNNGWLLIEHGYNQGLSVREIFNSNNFSNVETIRDYANLERFTLGCYLKN